MRQIRPERSHRGGRPAAVLALVLLAAAPATAQFALRPDDPLGLSVRERRVRVIHSPTPEIPGTSMHLQMWDPWLAYQRGRSYFFREWNDEDFVFRHLPTRPEAAATNSCGVCHNTPFPSVGAGGVVAIKVRAGRNAVHFFGGGLLETLGMQIRAQILAANDDNGNGYLDVPAETRGRRATVEAAPGVEVDFGSLEDLDGNGRPDLNGAIMVRPVDGESRRLFFDASGRPPRLGDPGIVGYDLAVGVFASSAGDHQFPSMRLFSSGVFVTIMGLLPEGDGVPVSTHNLDSRFMLTQWGRLSNSGSFLSELMLTANPFAVEDPARRPSITEGELDLLDWFMLNHPAPAVTAQTERTRRGRRLLDEMGCTSCHVPDWHILPADEERGLPGDRRFFRLDVHPDAETARLEGRLHSLTKTVRGPHGAPLRVPRRDGFVVENVFTDLRHHDLGPRFWEYAFYGGRLRALRPFRTAPLWGVGSTVRHGHDGMSLSVDDVIRRHGGEAEAAANAYAAAPEEDRRALLAFLDTLVLYAPETLPTDLDGDGAISPALVVDGRDLGPEVFRPELLFQVKPRYKGWTTDAEGNRYFSYALLNVAEAYGESLEALRDSDGDGVPDLSDPTPLPAVRAATEPAGSRP